MLIVILIQGGAMSKDKGPELKADSDFEYLLTFLPPEWDQMAKKLGALRRCRKFDDAKVLLRILLMHLAEGCSLRETAVRARQGKLADVSDVAIMDRLRQAEEWFRWMNTKLMEHWVVRHPRTIFGEGWNVRVVDGTQVKEPGPTGSSWRIHYAVGLPSLRCSAVEVTDSEGFGNGETFVRFPVTADDLFIGDRAYGLTRGIAHVIKGGGDVLVRFGWNALPLWSSQTKRFNLFRHLHKLQGTAIGDWAVSIRGDNRFLPGRVCAIKKSRQAAEKARKDVLRKAQKHSAQILPETLDAASYVFVFTSIPSEKLAPTHVLEFYRGRWQVELVFKRLKSLMAFGHLRKRDDQSAKAWIQGKLFVAFLLEALLRQGESFFPWGYPILSD
jgi:hypothetical protein